MATKLSNFDIMDTIGKSTENSSHLRYTIEQLLQIQAKSSNVSEATSQVEGQISSQVEPSSTQEQKPPSVVEVIAEPGGAVVNVRANSTEVQDSKSVKVVEDPVDDPADGLEQHPDHEGSIANDSLPAAEQSGGGEGEPKKKKKNSSGKKKAKALPVTGFEEFFADPPLTPSEDAENKDFLYAPDRSFVERIETCIQRYRARRKLDAERSKIFTKYMVLGGIDAGIKPFTGGIDRDGTAQEIAAVVASDFVGTNNIKYFDMSNSKHWVVDFEGVVKGFLSYRAPRVLGLNSRENIKTCCGVIRNFLNYVVHHGVCPEYTQDLMRAKIICDKAEKELWVISGVGRLLPGSFNTACSVLYGGYYKHMYIPPDSPWAANLDTIEMFGPHVLGMPKKEALHILKTAIALIGNETMYRGVASNTIRVIKQERRFFEITEIVRTDDKVEASFAAAKDIHGEPGGMKSIGVMRVKYCENPEPEDEDCSDDGLDNGIMEGEDEFWLEDFVLSECLVGLKMDALVYETNVGLKYFDTLEGIYCSFHTVLPNESMELWREPSICSRGPPTVDNPNAVADAEAGEDDDDEPPELAPTGHAPPES